MKKSLLLILVAIGGYTSAQSIKYDKGLYPPPTPPALPAAGSKFTDPTFGTTLLRVTDANDGNANNHSYSYWPCFNKNSSMVYISGINGVPTLFDLDTANFTISNKRPMFTSNAPDGEGCRTDDVIWSAYDTNIVYVHTSKRLYTYDVVSKNFTLVKDFSTKFQNLFLAQMSKSMNDNVFGFTIKNDNTYLEEGYFAYNKVTDKYYHVATNEVDEVQVDKDGNYLVVKTGLSGLSNPIEVKVVDLLTEQVEDLHDGSPDYSPGHSDNGHGFVIGADNWNGMYRRRSLATPHQHEITLDFDNIWTNDSHFSLTADNEEWGLFSTFNEGVSTQGFIAEIFQVSTDGEESFRRLAHHHSVVNDYYDQPRANISRDGKFVCFTSNWGGNGQRDVFLLKIPPAPVSPTTSIAEKKSNGVNLWPNPASDLVYCQLDNTSANSFRLLDITGRVVMEQVFSSGTMQSFTIDTKSLPRGIYHLKVYDNKGEINSKLIIGN